MTISDNIPAPFRDLFNQFNKASSRQPPHKAISAGSGFIIDKAGFDRHQQPCDRRQQEDHRQAARRAQLHRQADRHRSATDIALLKINSDKPLPTVEFGDDRQLRVGDWVVAVGNPFGLSNSVTAGIVSSHRPRHRRSQQYNDFIQIDAPINRGNSGGPTFDLRGQVVGMNSMIFSPSGGSVGIGFAIPASTIHDVVAQLKAHGHVARGYLGVEIQSVTPEIASSLGLKDAKGAIVANVVPGGPAAKAGFEQGDIVTAIDGKAVEDATRPDPPGRQRRRPAPDRDLHRQPPGQAGRSQGHDRRASRRQGGLQRRRPRAMLEPASGQRHGPGPVVADAGSAQDLSISPTPSTGVVITKVDPDSDAADKGLQPGDVVLKVGNRMVTTPQDVQAGVAEAKKGGRKSVLLLVAPARAVTGFVAVDIGKT